MLQLAVDAQDLGYPSLQLTVDLLHLQTIRRPTLKLHPYSPADNQETDVKATPTLTCRQSGDRR